MRIVRGWKCFDREDLCWRDPRSEAPAVEAFEKWRAFIRTQIADYRIETLDPDRP